MKNPSTHIMKYPRSQEYLLLILHELQNRSDRHYLSEEDLKLAADYTNSTYGSVYGVARYYTMFSLKPRGKHLIRVCHSPVCDMLHSSSLIAGLKDMLGIEIGETTPDGFFTLELTECLGQCDKSPTMMVDRRIHARVTPQKAGDIIARLREKAEDG
jgi:NADH:ubiquinone oxidoreductase subunit E